MTFSLFCAHLYASVQLKVADTCIYNLQSSSSQKIILHSCAFTNLCLNQMQVANHVHGFDALLYLKIPFGLSCHNFLFQQEISQSHFVMF